MLYYKIPGFNSHTNNKQIDYDDEQKVKQIEEWSVAKAQNFSLRARKGFKDEQTLKYHTVQRQIL